MLSDMIHNSHGKETFKAAMFVLAPDAKSCLVVYDGFFVSAFLYRVTAY